MKRLHRFRASKVLALAVVLGLFTALPLAAQDGTVRGTVIEANTQRPLSGAQVSVEGSTRGAITNSQGVFVISGVPAGDHTVRAQRIGYGAMEQEATVVAGEAIELTFRLGQRAVEMDELVVTGTPGARARRAIGNSVATVSAERIVEAAPITNVTQLLQGRTPGLTIMQPSGQAGTAANFRIRGASSLSAGNHPVFYVDGVRITSGAQGGFGTGNNTRRETSALDMLNPADIESIEVIRGPAAATLYGADAAAGVIQIITKKGSQGQQGVQWTARSEFGRTDWHLPMRQNYTLCTVPGELAHTSTSIGRIGHSNWPGCDGMDPNAPWQERLLVESPLAEPGVLQTGGQWNLGLSARGGGDRYSFYISGDREEEDGVFQNNWFNRTSGRANFTVTPLDNLDLTVTSQYSRTDSRQPLNDNASNGWLRNAWRGIPGLAAPYAMGWRGLGPDEMGIYNDVTDSERFVFGATANWQPYPWFSNRLNLGMDAGDRIATLFYPIDQTGRQPFGATNAQGYISNFEVFGRDYTVNYAGTISNDFTADISSSFSFGAQYIRENNRSVQTVGEGLIADAVRLIHPNNNLDVRAFENMSQQRSLGFFLEEQLGWRNRLFLTAGARIDDHSTFGANFSTVVYPKAAVSYVISEEPFFHLPHVDNLRLRAAYGQAGNAPSPFAADRIYGAATAVADDGTLVSALTPDAYGNPDLRAERGEEVELGFESSLFNDALGVDFTYYSSRTRDALISVPVAPSTGFGGSTMQNVGTVANSGLELMLSGSPMRTRNLTWDVQAGFSTNRNELRSLGATRDFIPVGYRSSQRHQEGFPLAGYWAETPLYDANGRVRVDENNMPIMTDTMEFVGPSAPTREASLTNTFTLFGDLQLYTFMDYKGGHYLFNMSEQSSFTWDQNARLANDPTVTAEEWALLRWGGNHAFIERADFVKLREVSLRYNLPSEWVGRFGADGLSFTLAGRNLAVWSGYSGADPEVNIGGPAAFTRAESNSAPMMRRLAASIDVRF
jgi:TonB-dependent starch-binding outer membrane protein SusC